MMATRKAAPPPVLTVPILVVTFLVAASAWYFQLPGAVMVWLGLLVAAWLVPPVILTGKKDSYGQVTPSGPGEEESLRAYRRLSRLRWRLLGPNGDWLPGWPVLGSWLAGVFAAFVSSLAPIRSYLPAAPQLVPLEHLLAAAAAFVVVVSVCATFRVNAPEGPGCPGTRVDSLLKMPRAVWVLAAAATGGLAAAGAVLIAMPVWHTQVHLPGKSLLAGLAGIIVFVAIVTLPWRKVALQRWRIIRGGIHEWAPRWAALKHDPAPLLYDRNTVGPATVDNFQAQPGVGAMGYWALAPKILPTVGSGVSLAVTSMPADDPAGQPIPGTKHPVRFQVTSWPSDQVPDLNTETDEKQVALYAQAMLSSGLGGIGFGVPLLLGLQCLTADGSTGVVWASKWAWPDGPTWEVIRSNKATKSLLPGVLGCEALIDHRQDLLYFGALSHPDLDWEGDPPVPGGYPTVFANLQLDDQWAYRWSQVLGSDANPPTLRHETTAAVALPGGVVVHQQAFVTRDGIDPASFFGLEPKLGAVLAGPAPFVSVTGWASAVTDRRGERHPRAFTVRWSETPVPTIISDLVPGRFTAGQDPNVWVIAGRMNAAFKAASLSRPEVASARALTSPRAESNHIWEVTIRLYAGDTLASVRGAIKRMEASLGVPWLRVGPSPDGDGCVLFVGARPEDAVLVSPRRDTLRLAALDLAQAFVDSKLTAGAGGQLPVLTAIGSLPKNSDVKVWDLSLPPGIAPSSIKEIIPRLKAATDNEFITMRTGVSGAASARLLACRTNPMPLRVPFDFQFVDASDGYPFATGIDGEPLAFRPTESPHLLLAGVTGAGKSALAQAFIYDAIIRRVEVFIIDPTKGCADFVFARPYARGFAQTIFEAAATIKGVYKEVERRKSINAKYGAGSYLELPEDIRPAPIVLLLDEFTSLIGTTPAPKASDDPEMEKERMLIEAENRARQEIGTYSTKIGREARSAGLSLFLGTQKLSAKLLDTIPGGNDLKANLARIFLGKASSGDLMSALRVSDQAPVLGDEIPKGRGLWESLTASPEIIQVWYATQEEYTAHLKSRVTRLADGDRMDISKHMPRLPTPGEAAGTVILHDDPDLILAQDQDEDDPFRPPVIEVDAVTFDLDDLDDYDDEGDALVSAADEEGVDRDVPVSLTKPEPELEPADVMPMPDLDPALADALLCLDVDGVLGPLNGANPEFTGWHVPGGSPSGSALVSTDMAGQLAAIGVPAAWLTSWGDDAAGLFAGTLPAMPVLPDRGAGDYGWWKIAALLDYLADHRHIRRVVWADDQLANEDDLGLNFAELATEHLGQLGVEHLLLVPDPGRGLTRADIGEIRAFLGAVAEPATDPVIDAELDQETTDTPPDLADPAALALPTPSADPNDPWAATGLPEALAPVDDPFDAVDPVSPRLPDDPWADEPVFIPSRIDDDPFA